MSSSPNATPIPNPFFNNNNNNNAFIDNIKSAMDVAMHIILSIRQTKINIAKDILRGLIYMHNRKPYPLVHRDIKTTNILLTESKGAKIADFGLAKFYSLNKNISSDNLVSLESNYDKSELTNEVGTERYMAPEIGSDTGYNYKIDIYSCGIVFYELFEGKIYFPVEGFKWYNCPKKIRKIIEEHMTRLKPEHRLEASDIIKML